ncbi:MAG TPA: TrpB-like pyridoxal phosphate-dependent enzyme [Chloroflexota bacterium]|nr:TrpB-like pyridoxal phosphate-dependent enzyme [Chloroflexota bacterium]
MSATVKFLLTEDQIPTDWYNILADTPFAATPAYHPQTKQPLGPADLAPIFPMELIKQEVSTERWVPIPDEVRDAYRLYRPTPLYRAYRLERHLQTPAHIYYKYEGVNPAGSHKPNTAIAQAYYNKEAGVRRLATETGAGQWGSALSMACALFGMECTVYMVRASYDQKPYRRSLMRTFGAEVIASPSDRTNSGRAILEQSPDSTGSLGIAISEAVEDAATHDDTNYSLGSVLNHVLMHQTVIGLEARQQMEMAGEYPDVVIGCVGGGSNFAGLAYPFVQDKLTANREVRILAVEPTACPTLTRGVYGFDFGDAVGIVPILQMHTLGHSFVPAPIHAGGLRYHGDAPTLSALVDGKVIDAVAYPQVPVFDAAVTFARTEAIVPAPESAHAIRAAIDLAEEAKQAGEQRVILFNLSGHGNFDLAAYDAYFAGNLENFELPQHAIDEALALLPAV